jgi:hypothetical protein
VASTLLSNYEREYVLSIAGAAISKQLDYGWTRYWYPFDRQIPMADGYLAYSGIEDGGSDQNGRTLGQLKHVPCLVLLGAPGMGKTREAEAAATSLRADSELVDLVYAGRRADPGRTLSDLLRGTNCTNWLSSGRTWYIFIDGIDEASGAAAGFEGGFQTFLDGVAGIGGEISAIRLRLLCRTVEWTATLDRTLETIWTDREVQKRQIGPLREIDVRNASDISIGDKDQAARFVNAMAESQVQALASRPVSFQLLADLFSEQGRIPPRQADLYRLGLQALLDEPDGARRGRTGRAALDPATRLTVAARIAAATAFSGVNRISTDASEEGPPGDAFSLAEIDGGVEPAPPFSFPVREVDLLDALRTPLFAAVGRDTYAWAHQTFMEYLAARYLVEHGLSPAQVLSFFSVEEPDGMGGIAPQLREIAAWVATMAPAFFQLLVDREPDVLLQSDVAAADPDDRKRLVESLLGRLNAGELVNTYASLIPLLGRLSHPGLSSQVGDFVSDASKALYARRAAIDIAEANGLDELAQNLAQIALAEHEPVALRADAAVAVSRLTDERARESLALLLKGNLSVDTSDELRGAVLQATWPAYLTLPNLLEAITPLKDPNLIGSYYMFLYHLDLGEFTPGDAIAALAWLRARLPSSRDPNPDLAAQRALPRIFWAAVAQSDDRSVREELAQLIADAFEQLSQWLFQETDDIRPSWPTSASDRLEIVRQVLVRSSDMIRASRYMHHFFSTLVVLDDLPVYLDAVKSTGNAQLRSAFIDIVTILSRAQRIDTLDAVWDAAEDIPELKSALRTTYYVDLDSPEVEWMRESLRRTSEIEERRARQEDRSSEVARVIKETLDRIEHGQAELWWRLNLQLFVSTTGRYEGEFEFLGDLKATPGWLSLSEHDQRRVVDGAFQYLTETKLTTSRWLGTNTQHRPSSAGFRALRLLRDERPETFDTLGSSVWTAWGSAAISFFTNNFNEESSPQVAIVRRAYQMAPEAIIHAITRMALGPNSEGVPQRVLELLEEVFDERLGLVLEALRNRTGLKGAKGKADLRAFLVRVGYRPSVRWVFDTLAAEASSEAFAAESGGDSAGAAREFDELAAAAAWLLADGSAEMWDRVLALRGRNPKLAKAIWEAFATARVYRQSQVMFDPSEDSLAQAYLDLQALFPGEPERGGADRFLSAVDHIDSVKGDFLGRLVAKGTAEAVAAIGRITKAWPKVEWLQWRMQEARQNFRAKARQLYPPREVIRVIGVLQPPLPMRNEVEAVQAALSNQQDSTPAFTVPTDASGPVSSVRHPIIGSSQKLKIIALATEWRSGHGGISTLNRELCLAMAERGHLVRCFTLEVSEQDKLEAQTQGVHVEECPAAVGIDGRGRFLLLRANMFGGLKPDVVIGHDHITGPYGLHLSKELGGLYAHFLHTVPEESEGIKTRQQAFSGPQTLRGDQKRTAQLNLSRQAQLVTSIGPKIHGTALQRLLEGPPLHEMIPGLNSALLKHRPNLLRLPRIHCLLAGRMEDADLKGARLGCQAIRKVGRDQSWGTGPRPRLIIRGFDHTAADAEFGTIGPYEDFNDCVLAREYTDDVKEIHNDIRESSLVIMPSRSEGFGLSAFEAIAAGVPIIVSFDSGLAEYIQRASADGDIDPAIVGACVANVFGEDRQVVDEWSSKINGILSNREQAFQQAQALRIALTPLLSWSNAADAFIKAVNDILGVTSPAATR